MIKLRDLEYLDAVARYRHFGHAAQACHVSQPTLSGQIMKLEEQLGLTLIERHPRGLLLTPAGEKLVEEARKVLTAASEFEQSAQALKDPYSGEMRVGLIPTLAPYLLPYIMPALTELLPRLQIYLYEMKTQELLDQLDAGSLDVLLLPYLDSMARYERYELFDEELLLAVYPGHPLASKKPCTLADLEGQQVLTLEDGHCLRDQSLDYCFAAGADEDERFQATSLETLRHMVGSRVGITLLPELATLDDSNTLPLCFRRFKKPPPTREIVLLTRPNYARLELVRKIVGEVRKQMRAVLKSQSGKRA